MRLRGATACALFAMLVAGAPAAAQEHVSGDAAGEAGDAAAEPAEDEPADVEPADVEPTEGEPAEDEPAEGEPADVEPTEGEPAEDEPAEDEPAEDEPAEDEPAEDEPAEEPRAGSESPAPIPTEYIVERIEIRGNDGTDAGVIRAFVPLSEGDTLDVDDPRIEAVRWRLLGTGWFDEVRLTIERGSERGRIVLVVRVSERNTLLIQGISLGFSEGLVNTDATDSEAHPYFGINLAELSLFGTGVSVEVVALLSVLQQGGRVRVGQANVGGSDWGLNGSLHFNNARDFFGNDDVVISLDECVREPIMELACEEARNAVVVYRRYGASIGTGTDIGNTWRFTLDWHFEAIELVDRPEAASHRRGTEIIPINFHIHDGWSFVSALQLGVTHDTRDNPGLPTEGRYVFVEADLATRLLGGSYDFVRVRAGWREWFRLPGARHALRLGLFVGAAVGDTPFFYRFYVADMSDLIPSRILSQNLDRRAPPNLLSTSIAEMRAQELAGRLDVEYSLWLYESRGELRGVVIYGLVGLYSLLDRDDLSVAIPGYEGFARVPVDLTFDIGVRLDTVAGVFSFGFSSLLGFIQL